MNKKSSKKTLTIRLISIMIIGFIATSSMILLYSEELLEEAILEQVKEQAKIYLVGLKKEILLSDMDPNKNDLEKLLDHFLEKHGEDHTFSLERLYIYDNEGNITADTAQMYDERKDMTGFHGEVIKEGKSFIEKGDSSHAEHDGMSGIYHADVIIPMSIAGENYAFEMQIHTVKTMENISKIDDRYERLIFFMVIASSIVMMILIWFLIKRGLIMPIQMLSEVTGRIAGGQLSSRVKIKTGSEMDDLGMSINVMADSIEEHFREQEQTYLQIIQSLAKALEAKDAYTAGHSERVTAVAVKLGRRIGLSNKDLNLLEQGAYMHDLGKIGISDKCLNKPERLEPSEYEELKTHPKKTADILAPLKKFKAFAEIATWHHERWDGTGYPDGLKRDEIPLLARIVAIADAWDAISGDRRYRKGVSFEVTLATMKKERNDGQWDPELLDQFIEMMEEELGHKKL